jgi:hypothetical protein
MGQNPCFWPTQENASRGPTIKCGRADRWGPPISRLLDDDLSRGPMSSGRSFLRSVRLTGGSRLAVWRGFADYWTRTVSACLQPTSRVWRYLTMVLGRRGGCVDRPAIKALPETRSPPCYPLARARASPTPVRHYRQESSASRPCPSLSSPPEQTDARRGFSLAESHSGPTECLSGMEAPPCCRACRELVRIPRRRDFFTTAALKSSCRRRRVPVDQPRDVPKSPGWVSRRPRVETVAGQDTIARRSSRELWNPLSPRVAAPRPSLASVSCHPPLGRTCSSS